MLGDAYPDESSAITVLRFLEEVARDICVLSPKRYRHVALGVRTVPRGRLAREGVEALTSSLTELIYAYYYLADPRMIATLQSPRRESVPIHAQADLDFVQQLRTATTEIGYLDPGWVVTAVEDAGTARTFLVHKARLSLSVRPDQVVPATHESLTIGTVVAVRFPKDRPYAMPGYYVALGSAGPPNGQELLVRWYFHLLPAAAPLLLKQLTSNLNEISVPFGLKMLNHPVAYTRPDAAVLYMPRGVLTVASRVVLAAYQGIEDQVRLRVPALTRQVRPGLAIAEEPVQVGRLVSFGQHRSRLIAQGVVDAAARGDKSLAGRVEAVLAAFKAAGILLDAPHLNPGSPEFDIASA